MVTSKFWLVEKKIDPCNVFYQARQPPQWPSGQRGRSWDPQLQQTKVFKMVAVAFPLALRIMGIALRLAC